MSASLTTRLWYGIVALLVGTFVVTHWPTLGSRHATSYRIKTPPPVTAADFVLLGHRLNLNCADVVMFDVLPGIGPALAARIVADRQVRGPFESIAAIERVRGIGPALFHRMQPFVQVGPCLDNS